jgi:hypothetical protein
LRGAEGANERTRLDFALQRGGLVFDRDAAMISLLGHEHSWGTHVKAARIGGSEEVLFDHDYDERMISHPLTVPYFTFVYSLPPNAAWHSSFSTIASAGSEGTASCAYLVRW